jgi:hypothetical protein
VAYTPQTWIDNNPTYPASATRFIYLEDGLQTAAAAADTIGPQITTHSVATDPHGDRAFATTRAVALALVLGG